MGWLGQGRREPARTVQSEVMQTEVDGQLPEFPGGLTGWILARLRSGPRARPRLQLIERIALAPHHSLALVQAEGRRFLVATSAEGGPAFYPLDSSPSDQDSHAADDQFPAASLHPGARVPAQQARASW